MNIDTLNSEFGIEGAARFSEDRGGLTLLSLRTGGATAEVYLYGAHVRSYQPVAGRPVLWMSRASRFVGPSCDASGDGSFGKPIRGGIPVCFPWFGVHPTDRNLPNHGFVRLKMWNVASVERTESGALTAKLSTASDSETLRLWPHEFEASLLLTLSNDLAVSLEIRNAGASPFTMTEALHAYFAVSDIRMVTLHGLDGAEYVDKLFESDRRLRQRGAVRFTAETDRPYLDMPDACTIEDAGWGRTIRIEKSGSRSTVVWNPWIAKARRMEDFGDDEWTGMLCVETANALTDAVSLDPGAAHTMGMKVGVDHDG